MIVPLRCAAALCIVLAACSKDDKPVADAGADDDEQTEEEPVDARASTGDDKKDASKSDAGKDAAKPPETKPEGEGCAAIGATAEARLLPVDIIWAIDTSGSMTASFPAIQAALTSFSKKVSEAGIDAHIIFLAGAGLCVPAPVGSGMCGLGGLGGGIGGGFSIPVPAPDTKQPNFLHLDISFGFSEGMGVILNNYPTYKDMLRPDARTHLVLTEDGPPPMSADAVVEHIEGRASATGQAAWNPPLAEGSWVFHGVVCTGGTAGGACLFALVPPTTTLDLVQRTGGISADLALAGSSDDPFAKLLDELAGRVIVGAELSCEYDIPPAPNGETFDRELVNVSVSNGSDAAETLRHVKSGECADNQAWSYDNDEDPKQIVLCPAACDAIKSQPGATLDVQFGCATIYL